MLTLALLTAAGVGLAAYKLSNPSNEWAEYDKERNAQSNCDAEKSYQEYCKTTDKPVSLRNFISKKYVKHVKHVGNNEGSLKPSTEYKALTVWLATA